MFFVASLLAAFSGHISKVVSLGFSAMSATKKKIVMKKIISVNIFLPINSLLFGHNVETTNFQIT